MKKMYLIFAMLFLVAGAIQAQDDAQPLVADWQGNLEVRPDTKLKVRFHIRNKDGVLTATMDSVDHDSFGLVFNEASYKDGVLTLKIDRINGSWVGKLEEGELKGTWTQNGTEQTLNLQKMKTS